MTNNADSTVFVRIVNIPASRPGFSRRWTFDYWLPVHHCHRYCVSSYLVPFSWDEYEEEPGRKSYRCSGRQAFFNAHPSMESCQEKGIEDLFIALQPGNLKTTICAGSAVLSMTHVSVSQISEREEDMVPLFIFDSTDHVHTCGLLEKLSAHRVIGCVGSDRERRWLETLACAARGPYFSRCRQEDPLHMSMHAGECTNHAHTYEQKASK